MPNPNRLRCANCRTRRTDSHAMFLHALHCRQETCHCMAYTFPHRKGTRMCAHNPLSDVRHAIERGESREVIEEIFIDMVWERGAVSVPAEEPCPF